MPFSFFKRRDGAPRPPPRPAPPPAAAAQADGCLLCGEGLAPRAEGEARCALCGAAAVPAERCTRGHAVCEGCLAGSPADLVERVCAGSEERDPVALALRLLSHARVRLRPEDHDQLVPSALVAAWSTARGEPGDRPGRVREARARAAGEPAVRRGRPERGAAAGAGVFVALAAEASRGAPDPALAARMVARAEAVIGSGDDARCLRRNVLVAVLAAARFAKDALAAELPARGIACERAGKNPTCVGAGCPFNR